MPSSEKLLGQMTSNESRTARNQVFHEMLSRLFLFGVAVWQAALAGVASPRQHGYSPYTVMLGFGKDKHVRKEIWAE
jgi:hypothetical protein